MACPWQEIVGDGVNATVAGPWWSIAKTNDFIREHTYAAQWTVMNVLQCGQSLTEPFPLCLKPSLRWIIHQFTSKRLLRMMVPDINNIQQDKYLCVYFPHPFKCIYRPKPISESQGPTADFVCFRPEVWLKAICRVPSPTRQNDCHH